MKCAQNSKFQPYYYSNIYMVGFLNFAHTVDKWLKDKQLKRIMSFFCIYFKRL